MKRTAPTPEHAFCTDCERTKRRTQLSLHPPFINQNPWQTHSGKITFITIIKHVHRCSQERNLHDSILDLIWSYRILVAQNLKGERHGKARNLITPTLWGLDWSPPQNHFWNDCEVVWPTHPLNSFFQHRLTIPWNHFSNHWPPPWNHFSRSSGPSKSFLKNDFVCHELLPKK